MTTQPDPQLIAEVDAIYHGPTYHRDRRPLPVVGTAPPIPQPGRPPMSQKAVDASTLMLTAGAASLPIGAVTIGVMLASGQADPTVIGLICAAPAALAIPILALSRLAKRAGEAAPAEQHHHYNAPVQQTHTEITNHNRWMGKTTNNL